MNEIYKKRPSRFSRLQLALLLFVSLIGQWSYAQMVELTTCSVTTSTTYGPMNTGTSANATGRYATIYPASQLTGLLNHAITSIYYRKGSSTNISGTPNFKIYLKETTDTDLGSASPDWATLITGATLVYDSNPVAATAGAVGWKGFNLNAAYNYTGSNLMVLTEYVNTGNTTSNSWYYEYGSPCISTSNSNTSKYVSNTTGTLGASLTTSNYRRPQIAFDYFVSCMWPGNVQVTSGGLTTLDVSWIAPTNAPASGYEVYYSTSSTPPTAATVPNLTGVMGTSVSIPNVTSNVLYYVWVRSKCSSTETSNWSTGYGVGSAGYCIPINTGTYYLKNIETTGATSNITYAATSFQSFVDNTSASFKMVPNSTIDISMTPSSGTNYYYMWVDWNNDLDFADTGETIFATTSYAANYATTFTLPASVTPGQYRVRFSNSYSGTGVACGGSGNGNHVDYILVVETPSCWAPTAVASSNVTHETANISWTAPTIAPAMGYEVYYATTNTPPTPTTVAQVTGIASNSTLLQGLLPVTDYYVWVRSVCSATDKSAWTTVEKFTTLCNPPVLASVTGQTVCLNGAATLTASTSTTGATVSWYADATSSTVLGTGNSFTTPALTSTTTYYASARTGSTAFVGKELPTVTTGNNGYSNLGLIFDATQNMTIETIDFYPYSTTLTSTTVTFNLLNSAGTILETKQVTLPVSSTATLNVIDLNFAVPAGTGYKLVLAAATSGTYALRENVAAQIAFPYTIPGVCSITGTTTSGYYYYLYNWKVSTGCESARQPVVATVDTNCLSTSETAVKNDLKVYPNPFVDVINISNVDEVKSAIVVDAAGRVVKTFEKVSQQLSLVDLKSGMYILKLNKKNGTEQTVKLIKK